MDSLRTQPLVIFSYILYGGSLTIVHRRDSPQYIPGDVMAVYILTTNIKRTHLTCEINLTCNLCYVCLQDILDTTCTFSKYYVLWGHGSQFLSPISHQLTNPITSKLKVINVWLLKCLWKNHFSQHKMFYEMCALLKFINVSSFLNLGAVFA